jgi:hypothetical protein
MKTYFLPGALVGALGIGALHAQSQEQPSSEQIVVANIQDERLADADAVRQALKNAGSGEKAALVAAFLQREAQRDAEAGAASLQAVLAGQAAWTQKRQQLEAAAQAAQSPSTEAAQ